MEQDKQEDPSIHELQGQITLEDEMQVAGTWDEEEEESRKEQVDKASQYDEFNGDNESFTGSKASMGRTK